MKGYIVGNGVTNWGYDNISLLDTAYWHSLITTETWEMLHKYKCSLDDQTILKGDDDPCGPYRTQFNDAFKDINIYNLFGICPGGGKSQNKVGDIGFSVVGGTIRKFNKGFSAREYTPWLYKKQEGIQSSLLSNLDEDPPCFNGNYIGEYLNDQTVRQ